MIDPSQVPVNHTFTHIAKAIVLNSFANLKLPNRTFIDYRGTWILKPRNPVTVSIVVESTMNAFLDASKIVCRQGDFHNYFLVYMLPAACRHYIAPEQPPVLSCTFHNRCVSS